MSRKYSGDFSVDFSCPRDNGGHRCVNIVVVDEQCASSI